MDSENFFAELLGVLAVVSIGSYLYRRYLLWEQERLIVPDDWETLEDIG